jgi:hypothetical protein
MSCMNAKDVILEVHCEIVPDKLRLDACLFAREAREIHE